LTPTGTGFDALGLTNNPNALLLQLITSHNVDGLIGWCLLRDEERAQRRLIVTEADNKQQSQIKT
jgi:hypothetical protein